MGEARETAIKRVVARFYRRRVVRVGPVIIEGYQLDRVEDAKAESNPFDMCTEFAERYANTPDTLVEVIAFTERGEEYRACAYTAGGGGLLFQRPARIQRIYVLDELAVRAQSPQPLDRLPSYVPGEDIYVYIGRLSVEDPKARAVLLETDMGSRIVMLESAGVKRDSNSSKAPSG